MGDIFLMIIAVLWNVFWFIGLPLLVINFLSGSPLIGRLFELAGEYAQIAILNAETYIFFSVMFVTVLITNYIFSGDIGGTTGENVDVETFRWTMVYFIFVIASLIQTTLVVYLIYKMQLMLAFFFTFSLFSYGHPLASISNLFLWYLSYLILAIGAVLFGYTVRTILTGPLSLKLRAFFNNNPQLQILEFLLINGLVSVYVAGIYFTVLESALKRDVYSSIDFKIIMVFSIGLAGFMIYKKYRYEKDELPFIDDADGAFADSPFFH